MRSSEGVHEVGALLTTRPYLVRPLLSDHYCRVISYVVHLIC